MSQWLGLIIIWLSCGIKLIHVSMVGTNNNMAVLWDQTDTCLNGWDNYNMAVLWDQTDTCLNGWDNYNMAVLWDKTDTCLNGRD